MVLLSSHRMTERNFNLELAFKKLGLTLNNSQVRLRRATCDKGAFCGDGEMQDIQFLSHAIICNNHYKISNEKAYLVT